MPFRFPGAQPFRFSAQRGVAQRMAPVYALLCIHRRIFYTVTRRRDSGAPPWRRYSRRRGRGRPAIGHCACCRRRIGREGRGRPRGCGRARRPPSRRDWRRGAGAGRAARGRREGPRQSPCSHGPSIQANPTPSAFIRPMRRAPASLGCFMHGQPARAAGAFDGRHAVNKAV